MKLPLILMGLIALSPWVNAGEDGHDHHGHGHEKAGSLDAHVHGASDLMIAIEGNDIEIEFESPAMNLVGFEHKANSAKDKATVQQTVEILNKHSSVFSISGSSCKLVDSSVDVSSLLESHNKHRGHEDHGHKNGHDHDKHDHDEHSDSETHSEITASYHFQCEDLNRLASMDVDLFKDFAGIHEINVMWLSESKQGAATLTSKNKTVSFK